jgi:hypothetical protein
MEADVTYRHAVLQQPVVVHLGLIRSKRVEYAIVLLRN